jgi:RNA polymerase sigma factor (TIGR02999 family)
MEPRKKSAKLASTADVSILIVSADEGDRAAADALFDVLYSELRRLAARELSRQGAPPVSVSATTLLHEVYLNMASARGPSFPDRSRFMAYASRVMRGLIIDHARSRSAQKRGGAFHITSIGPEAEEGAIDDRDLTRISDALDELATINGALAEIVDLKFFCGFSFAEIAAMRHISERSAQRMWEKARIYLYRSVRADLSL